jgi:hypothetical protein
MSVTHIAHNILYGNIHSAPRNTERIYDVDIYFVRLIQGDIAQVEILYL